MKKLIAVFALLASIAAPAAVETVEIAAGGSWESPGYAAPSGAGAYIAPGEKVGWSGTAKGRVWLFIEK